MTMQDKQNLPIEALCTRWQKNPDQIVELAIAGELELWIAFTDVFLQKVGKAGAVRKKKVPVVEFHNLVALKPVPEVLRQLLGRFNRLMIAAEVPCLDAKNKPITVTNSVGEEWGESSMIGMNPVSLFALLDDVLRYERKNKMPSPADPHALPADTQTERLQAATLNPQGHPCFAEELHVAMTCWQSLCLPSQTHGPATAKGAILRWLRENHPELSNAAAERIALVVAPSKKRR